MEFNEVMTMVMDNILKPLLTVAGTSLPVIVGSYASKITKSIKSKNEIEVLCKENEMKATLTKEIGTLTESAVGSNMQISKKMKSMNSDGKLTDEQMEELNKSAKEIIMASLPESLTTDGGELNKLMGGSDRLDAIIDTMIEKYVYEYQIKDESSKSSTIKANNTKTSTVANAANLASKLK